MTELVVRMVFSLSIVLGLMLLAARVAGKRYRTHTGSTVKVLQRQALSRGSTVTVVSVGNRVLVLGTTEQQVRVLTELDPSEIASPEDAGSHAAVEADPEPSRLYAVPETDFAQVLLAAQETAPGTPAAADERPSSAGRHAARHRADRPTESPAVPATRAAEPGQPGALAGSLLSPQTWRQALQALTGRAS